MLVEYVRYRPFDPRAIGNANRFGRARYSAFVLGPSGRPHWVELGEAATIDGQIRALREALQSSAGDVLPVARALARTLIDPIERDLTGMERLVIAPDSELSVVPFSALQDSRNRFLVQRLEVSYVTSGRDLVRLSARQAPRESPLIVADPDLQSAAAGTGRVLFGPALRDRRRGRRPAQAASQRSHVLTGPAATETTLKAVKGPRILHVATHGFFRDLSPQASSSPGAAASATAAQPPQTSGPLALLRSGLALAGANQRQGGNGEDGLLTAYEAANLDLHGTQLVVLSACETGLGQVASGDGVYGLRRALEIAGAETLVMSLWRVDDNATRDLMTKFYQRLTAGNGRSASLRTVQLELLKSRDYSHPFYWAPFIIAGDWTPLRTN